MNVYDFDKTIYKGDSSVDFFKFCLFRHPVLLLYIPYQILIIIAYKLHLCRKEKAKSVFFSFIKSIPNLNEEVQLFWNHKIKFIASWYLNQQRIDDVVISASPEFLLSPVCKTLGISQLIATKVDEKTGKLLSKNCYGEEKARQFDIFFPRTRIDNFYSDSISDTPMACKATTAYLVKSHQVIKLWNYYDR